MPRTSARRSGLLRIACLLLAAAATAALPAAETFDIALAADGSRIDGLAVTASRTADARTLVLVGGLGGDAASAARVRAAVEAYAQQPERPYHLLAVPMANPARSKLGFPPAGTAYRENVESHALWRWLGTQAPDLVLIADAADAGLATALSTQAVASIGRIPARAWGAAGTLPAAASITRSEAARELHRRHARSPRELATELAQVYGRDFDQPWYIGAIALIARLRLGELDAVRALVEPWVNGTRNSLERPNALVMSGHIVFTELARRTNDPRHVDMVRRVADMGFDAQGRMLEAMPLHDGYSDSVFMGTAILAQAGALTGDSRYFQMADRHLRFMQRLDRRTDGLYRHRPEADVAWGRGNGFAALGLALTLEELPEDGDAHRHALESYRQLMAALLPLQNRDGLWRNVVDHPGAFPEYSGTAMIGFALQRGLARGWIRGAEYQRAVDAAWESVNARTGADGTLINVCESTARLTTLQEYLQRTAILGQDARGGAMALLFATERMQ